MLRFVPDALDIKTVHDWTDGHVTWNVVPDEQSISGEVYTSLGRLDGSFKLTDDEVQTATELLRRITERIERALNEKE